MKLSFLGACLASVAMSLDIRSDSELLLPDASPVEIYAQTDASLDIRSDSELGLQLPVTPVEQFFAQTDATALSTAICQRTATSNKKAVPDFYQLYSGSTVFSDSDFPHTSANTLSWADAKETFAKGNTYQWKRAKDVYSDHTLFGSKGVTPQDMRQGSIGNCWFISAASALSEVPGRVEKVFLNANNEISKNGIYAVNFYTLGVPHTVVVDDYLPLQTWGGKLTTIYASPSTDKAIFGPILEKAFAKYHGNYSHIVGGDARQALKTLYGAPATQFVHSKTTADALWTALEAADKRKDVIQTGTAGSNHSTKNAVGLSNGHAYTVLSVIKIKDDSGTEVKLVKVRNPWGTENYKGDYSDSSAKWTSDAMKTRAGMVKANDGEFFMPIDLYKKWMSDTTINFNMDKVTTAHHLTLNAPKNNNTGKIYCTTCTYYKFNVTTATDQKVNMKFATWEQRGIPSSCKAQYDKTAAGGTKHYHIAYYSGGHFGNNIQSAISSKGGEIDFGQVALKAGQTYAIEVEMDWGDEEEARDFSVVVNGMSGGTVAVARSDGVATAKLPVIWRNGKAPPNPAPITTTPAVPATTGTTTKVSDDTFTHKKSAALNKAVNDFKPTANMGICGAAMKQVTHGTKTVEFLFKSTCEQYSVISEWTITLSQTVWAQVRTAAMFDMRPGAKKYTYISGCKKLANGNESCKVSLRKINGVMQDSAAITLPYWYGNLGIGESHYQDYTNYNLKV